MQEVEILYRGKRLFRPVHEIEPRAAVTMDVHEPGTDKGARRVENGNIGKQRAAQNFGDSSVLYKQRTVVCDFVGKDDVPVCDLKCIHTLHGQTSAIGNRRTFSALSLSRYSEKSLCVLRSVAGTAGVTASAFRTLSTAAAFDA